MTARFGRILAAYSIRIDGSHVLTAGNRVTMKEELDRLVAADDGGAEDIPEDDQENHQHHHRKEKEGDDFTEIYGRAGGGERL